MDKNPPPHRFLWKRIPNKNCDECQNTFWLSLGYECQGDFISHTVSWQKWEKISDKSRWNIVISRVKMDRKWLSISSACHVYKQSSFTFYQSYLHHITSGNTDTLIQIVPCSFTKDVSLRWTFSVVLGQRSISCHTRISSKRKERGFTRWCLHH